MISLLLKLNNMAKVQVDYEGDVLMMYSIFTQRCPPRGQFLALGPAVGDRGIKITLVFSSFCIGTYLLANCVL